MIQPKHIENINIVDIDEIMLIERCSYKNPWVRSHFKNDINNKSSMNYIYRKDKKILGYLFGYLIKDEYQLNKITVKEEFRCQKIGKLLFSHCLNQLVDLNVKCVQLEVSSLNLIAQRFYKKIGFIRVGMRKKYYSEFEDALLYNLEIK
tara:strand:- start:861 stop:1307 length:447 start_codon:yes stop_codon:yes gene_type:complete